MVGTCDCGYSVDRGVCIVCDLCLFLWLGLLVVETCDCGYSVDSGVCVVLWFWLCVDRGCASLMLWDIVCI